MPNEGKLKKKLKAGEVVVGPFCTIPSMAMVEALGRGGMDFLIIDTEHGPIDISSAQDMCIAADNVGAAVGIDVDAQHLQGPGPGMGVEHFADDAAGADVEHPGAFGDLGKFPLKERIKALARKELG